MNYEFQTLGSVELLDSMPENAKVIVEVDGATKRAPQVVIPEPVDEIAIIANSETLIEVPEGATALVEVGGEIKRVPGSALGSSVQPDWNQNDPNAADYVKNRTHYKTNGELFNGTVVVEEGWNDSPLGVAILEGERYVVLFDGVEYDLVGKTGEYIGNDGLWYEEGATDGQPPFAYGHGWLTASDGEHTFVVTGNTYTRIDKNYLPVGLVQNVNIDYGSTPDELEAARLLFRQGAQLRLLGDLVISESGSMDSGQITFTTSRGNVVCKSDGTHYVIGDFLYPPPHRDAIEDGEYVANEEIYLRSSGGKTFRITLDDSGIPSIANWSTYSDRSVCWSPVTDDHINSLINNALGVIENGTY
jgi:hypothetical protein